DEIADVVRVEALLSMHEVVEDDDFARWNAKTQRCRLTALQALSALRIAEHPTRPRIPRRFACRQLLLARNAQLRRRTKAGIRQSQCIQLREPFLINGAAFLLSVAAVRPSDVRTLVPFQP